ERAQLALGAEEVRPHRRMLLDKLLQALGDRRACHRDSFLLFGEGSQRCGDVNLHCFHYLRSCYWMGLWRLSIATNDELARILPSGFEICPSIREEAQECVM